MLKVGIIHYTPFKAICVVVGAYPYPILLRAFVEVVQP